MGILNSDLKAIVALKDKMVTVIEVSPKTSTYDGKGCPIPEMVKIGFSNGTWLKLGDIGEDFWSIHPTGIKP